MTRITYRTLIVADAPLLGHRRSKTYPDPLVHVVGYAHSRGHFAEVWKNTPVEAKDSLRPQDIPEQPKGMCLLFRQLQL